MPLPELITDRTAEDYVRALELSAIRWQDMTPEQQTEWQTNLKGAYNASDLNRVTEAVEYLAAELLASGYDPQYRPVEIAPGRTEWRDSDVPTVAQLDQYLGNVSSVRAAIVSSAPPLPSSMANLSFDGANDIERVLDAVWTYLQTLRMILLRAGMPWAISQPSLYFAELLYFLMDSNGINLQGAEGSYLTAMEV